MTKWHCTSKPTGVFFSDGFQNTCSWSFFSMFIYEFCNIDKSGDLGVTKWQTIGVANLTEVFQI